MIISNYYFFKLRIYIFGIKTLYITTLGGLHKYIGMIKINYILKAFLGGIIIVILTLIVGDEYLGLGFYTIKDALSSDAMIHKNIPWYTFILKTIFTSLTLAFGGSGGVITPIFYVGATSENFFGYVVDGYIPLFVALGFVSVAGTTSDPIAAIIMSVELFGIDVGQ